MYTVGKPTVFMLHHGLEDKLVKGVIDKRYGSLYIISSEKYPGVEFLAQYTPIHNMLASYKAKGDL